MQVRLEGGRRLTELTLSVTARCSDRRRRTYTLDFSSLEVGAGSGPGDYAGSFGSLSGSFFGGPTYQEQASFSAHVTARAVTGTARSSRTYGSSLSCRTPAVHFRLPV